MKDTHRPKVKRWKKIFHANEKKKAGVAILTCDKVVFKIRPIVRGREGHYIMIKAAIQQQDATLVNIYALNRGPPICKVYLDEHKKRDWQ